tara:strand:+ start:4981 stop:5163 length:183 start_codon:yes stop_codon:yes gene_type:complete
VAPEAVCPRRAQATLAQRRRFGKPPKRSTGFYTIAAPLQRYRNGQFVAPLRASSLLSIPN